MKASFGIVAILLTTGCAGTYHSVKLNDHEASSPVEKLSNVLIESKSSRSPEHDHGADFGVYRAEPLLERMPFGASMSGPWDTGGGPGDWLPPPDDTMPDFAGKDIHTVMHYLALRTGLHVIVEGELDLKLTVTFRTQGRAISRDGALEVIQSICKANKLDYIHDGNIVIIKKRPQELALAHVVLSELDGHYDVSFDDHELVAAIMEVATVTKTQVFVPVVQVEPPTEEEKAGLPIESVKITLQMRAALPERILRRLAELGGMEIEQVKLEDSVDGVKAGYKFTYRK